MGAATVSRLHADLTFMVGLEAAKAELATARAKNLSSQRDCKFGSDGPGGQLATNIRTVRSPLARLARQEEPPRCPDDVARSAETQASKRPFENPFNGGFGRDSSLGRGPQRRVAGWPNLRRRPSATRGSWTAPES